MRWTVLRSSVVALAAFGCSVQQAQVTGAENQLSLSQPVEVPAAQTVTVTEVSCAREDGAWVVTDGTLELSGVVVQLDFRNNQRGTHSASQVTTLHAGRARLADPSRARAMVSPGEDAYVWMQLLDAQGEPLSEEIFLGSCGAATGTARTQAPVPGVARVTAATRNCTNTGPRVTVSSALQLSGLRLRFTFRSESDPGGEVLGTYDTTAELVAVNEGREVSLPKQPAAGGVGGNPWIYVQVVDGAGQPLGEQLLLGRCIAEPETDDRGG